MNFLRDEKLVMINGKSISRNGFKNLTFETSRYSGSFDAARGFGSVADVRNLSQIDQFNIDFLITADEIKGFARMLAEFKALGVLPLKNEYILNKIKGTLAYEKAFIKIKETTKKDNDNETDKNTDKTTKKIKEITHVNVFLESFSIKSLERTSNGFEVSLVLSLYRRGFSDEEAKTFDEKFKEWSQESAFEASVTNGIDEYDLDDGSLTMEYISLEKLNAKTKTGALIQFMNETVYDETEYILKKEERDQLLNEYEDLYKSEEVTINSVNIGQIEFITRNNISNIPLYGEPIGLKSFMGQSQSHFVVKLIFDESDDEIMNRLKLLSDQNIINTVLNLKQSILNIFDMHTASISKMFFNNIEEANGVMVTIVFDVNSYNYNDGDLNPASSFYASTDFDKNQTFEVGSFYLELLCGEHVEIASNSLNLPENINNQEYGTEKEWNFNTDKIEKIFNSPLQSTMMSRKAGNNAINKTDTDTTMVASFTLGNLFRAYSPQTDLYKTIIRNDFSKGVNLEKLFDFNIDANKITTREIVKSRYYYDWIEAASYAKANLSKEIQDRIKNYYNNPKNFNNNGSASMKTFVEDATSQMFNEKFFTGDKIILWFNKYYYELMLSNIFDILFDNIDFGSNTYDTTNGFNFKLIKTDIEKVLKQIFTVYSVMLDSGENYDRAIEYVLESMNKAAGTTGEYSGENTYYTVNSVTKEELVKMKQKFLLESENRFTKYSQQAYGIFLTKLCYLFSKERIEGSINFNLEELLKTTIISSAYQTFFHIKNERTNTNLGFLIKEGFNSLGYRLGMYLYTAYKSYPVNEKIEESERQADFLRKQYGYYAEFSAILDNLSLNPWVQTLSDEKIGSTVKKDYNYFYGRKIKFNKGFLMGSFDLKDAKNIKDVVTKFNIEAIKSFIKGDKYCSESLNLGKISLVGRLKAWLPTNFTNPFFKRGKENKITDKMKTRIIGNYDSFAELNKISKEFCSFDSEVIPDYDVYIGSHLNEIGSGMMNDSGLSNYIEVSNVSEIKISKDPKSKIKNARIVLSNFDKQIINKNGGDAISISVKKGEEGIELYTIKSGDDVMINLGYIDNKKMVFNGFVRVLQNYGNVIILECSSFASGLYNTQVEKGDYKDQGLFKKTILSPFSQNIQGLSNMLDGSEKVEFQNAQILFAQTLKYMTNQHIFQEVSINESEEEFSVLQKYNYNLDINVSCANLFKSLVTSLPSNIKAKLSGKSSLNIRGAIMVEANRSLNSIYGIVDEVNYDDLGNDLNSSIYKDIYMVDLDYDTYGLANGNKKFEERMKKVMQLETVNNIFTSSTTTPNNNTIEETDKIVKPADKVVIEKPKEENVVSSNEFIWPMTSTRVTSKFDAKRIHPVLKKPMPHNGIDIGSVKSGDNDPVWAAADGKVIKVAHDHLAGNYINIEHEKGYVTRYLHLANKSTTIKEGQKVSARQILGKSGMTGRSKGVHLHFGLIKDGVPIDPMTKLKKER
ncbi:MAG: M23 family metallopeptidase [Cetobacterium sp.]